MKTNWNLIKNTLNAIPDGDIVYEYQNYNIDIQFPLDEIDSQIIVSKYEAGLNEQLLSEIHDLLNESKEKLQKLFNKYPDETPAIGTEITVVQIVGITTIRN